LTRVFYKSYAFRTIFTVTLWNTAQYEADVVDVEVCVNSKSPVHRRSLTYTFSSLDLARHLSAFYSRLLSVACQNHHHHHHHQQQQQSSERISNISALDEALAKTIDEEMPTSVRQSLFAIYRRHSTGNCMRALINDVF